MTNSKSMSKSSSMSKSTSKQKGGINWGGVAIAGTAGTVIGMGGAALYGYIHEKNLATDERVARADAIVNNEG